MKIIQPANPVFYGIDRGAMSEKELLGRIRENCITQAAAERIAATITTDPVAIQALRERIHAATPL